MKIENKYPSPLKMEKIIISECQFSRSEDSIDQLELGVSVKRKTNRLEDDRYRVELEIFIGDDSNNLDLHAKCIGYFQVVKESSMLIERNAIAIIFPYLRSYISTVTAQPGMTPIVLPPMNVITMLQQLEAASQDE